MIKLSRYSFLTSYISPEKKIFLLFSGRTGRNIAVSESLYYQLQNNINSISEENIKKLSEQEIIVPEDQDEFEAVNKKNIVLLQERKELKNLYISIQPSANCQLACDYCGQKHNRKNIDDNSIDKIINRIEHKLSSNKFKSLAISWFGGEPLLGINQMRKLNNKLKEVSKKYRVEYSGKVTTNGMALSLALYEELITDFNIKGIEITLDGSREFHDARKYTVTKKGSFDIIFKNLVDIVKSPLYNKEVSFINIRCNVDQRNIEGVVPLLKLFVENGIQQQINFYFTNVYSWAQNGAGEELCIPEFANKSLDYYIYLKKHGFKLINLLPKRTPPVYCIATNEDAEMYDSYGYIYDCSETSYSSVYDGSEFILGNLSHTENKEVKRSSLLNYINDQINGKYSKCKECKFFPLCGGGCAKAMTEGTPRCPSFIYNIEKRMLLDYLLKNIENKKDENNSNIF